MAKKKETVETENQPFVMKAIRPRNEKQKQYLELLNDMEKPLVLASGLAGTSKSYLATYVAARRLSKGEIEHIYIVRPPVSDSKSLGYFAGDLIQKCSVWSAPITNALTEFLGRDRLIKYLEEGVIQMIPLEVLKGWTLKNGVAIVDEAEDITWKEFMKCSTRVGENGMIVFCGDICQVDLKTESGLEKAIRILKQYPDLFDWSHVDFDKDGEVVRSPSVRKTISGFRKIGEM